MPVIGVQSDFRVHHEGIRAGETNLPRMILVRNQRKRWAWSKRAERTARKMGSRMWRFCQGPPCVICKWNREQQSRPKCAETGHAAKSWPGLGIITLGSLDVPISFARVCADHNNVTRWTPVSIRPRQTLAENLEETASGVSPTMQNPLYDVPETVKAIP